MTQKDENKKAMRKLIIKAWKDEKFKEFLINNPEEAFKEFGIQVQGNKNIEVLEESDDKIYFILPQSHSSVVDLSESELENLSAGYAWCLTGEPMSNDH